MAEEYDVEGTPVNDYLAEGGFGPGIYSEVELITERIRAKAQLAKISLQRAAIRKALYENNLMNS